MGARLRKQLLVGFKSGLCIFSLLIWMGCFPAMGYGEVMTAVSSEATYEASNLGDENSQIHSIVSSFEINFPYLRGSEHFIRHAFDPESNTLYLLDHGRDYLFRISATGRIDTLMTEFMADDTNFYLFDIAPDGESLFFWEEEVGSVFKLRLSSLEFYQVDETTVEKLMRGHTAVFCPDNLIYTFGGYGVWEEKNFLLYFDENIKGWLRINHEGPRPPRSENPFMAFEHGGGIDRFHVLIPKTEERRQFIYYQFDRYQPEWKEIVDLELPQSVSLPEHTVVATHTHRFDTNKGLFHLMDDVFFNVEEATLMKAEHLKPDDLLQGVYYYSPQNEEWVRVGLIERDNFLRLHVSRVHAEDLILTTLTRPPFLFRNQTFMTVLMIGGFAIILIFLSSRKSKQETKSESVRIRLQRNAFGVQVTVDGRNVSLSDPKLSILWELIYRMVEDKQSSMNLAELNYALFNQEQLDSHISRVRSKLIKLVQEQVGEEFIWIEKNKLDKRFKVIRIRLELVEILS